MEMCLGDKDFPKQKGPLAPAEHLTEQRYAPHERQASPDKNVHPIEFPEGNPIQQGKLSLHNRSIYPISRTLF
jgi:hypothetical protein